MSSPHKRVARPFKREADDDLRSEGAFAANKDYNEEVKHHPRKSPKKGNQRKSKRQHDYDDEESDDDEDEDAGSINDFIDDEDVDDYYDEGYHRPKKDKKKKKVKKERKLDVEDHDLIGENIGIKLQTNKRLKRNADRFDEPRDPDAYQLPFEQKHEAKAYGKEDVSIVDTSSRRKQTRNDMSRGLLEDLYEINEDKAVKVQTAADLFKPTDEFNIPMAPEEDYDDEYDDQIDFAAAVDPIDDPFSTQQDKVIEQTDICERIHVRLRGRFRPEESEIVTEADWILSRLVEHKSLKVNPDSQRIESDFPYRQLYEQPEARAKIIKVLKLLRMDLRDVPFIAHYMKVEYARELDEASIWIIYNLDQEYGTFLRQKTQISAFLEKLSQIDPAMKLYEEDLNRAMTKSDLNNFQPLISFLSSYFQEKLKHVTDEGQSQRKKQPLMRDEIQIAKQGRIEQFAALFALSRFQFLDNVKQGQMAHVPPMPADTPKILAQRFLNDQYPSENLIHSGVCKFAALELSAQPFIRSDMKKYIAANAHITTVLTDQGKKDLDLFHQSYRVKCVQKMPISRLRFQHDHGMIATQASELNQRSGLMSSSRDGYPPVCHYDLYLDILQCEKAGLISVHISVDPVKQLVYKNKLMALYMQSPESETDQWNILRKEIIEILVEKLLTKELINELREEIREEAEQFVIAKCKETYKHLLMTGPYSTRERALTSDGYNLNDNDESLNQFERGELVKDRERNVVMGAIMRQIDANSHVVTIAIVDRYGELLRAQDFMHLLPPRKRNHQNKRDDQTMDKRPQQKTQEENEHEMDKRALIELLEDSQVDLIVVAANCLEARNLKRNLESIASEFRKKSIQEAESHGKKGQIDPIAYKNVQTIWGSTEVPKLFSMSHNSRKMHKNVQQMWKLAIALARFEQDPLCEVINLWSPITAENQALALSLDPMQKLVSQTRLADGLEEVNIQIVNEVGVDLNMLCEHEHMHAMLQFVSGLGPRKAKRLIQKIKGSHAVETRDFLRSKELLKSNVFYSANAFLKIRVPDGHHDKSHHPLDQTRVQMGSYKTALYIATKSVSGGQNTLDQDKNHQMDCLLKVIQNPSLLKSFDLKAFIDQSLAGIEDPEQVKIAEQVTRVIADQIIQELSAPFGDPRKYRSQSNQQMSNERLFYLLIEESKHTFKRGLIVTASVTKVFESKAICRLDNGLNAIVQSSAFQDKKDKEKLDKRLEYGRIIQGRIDKISFDEEQKFEVQLTCKEDALASHEQYVSDLALSLGIEPEQIDKNDLINQNFTSDQRPKQSGRFIPRRIAHEKFKNISSRRAISELTELQSGEFFFRPSTRSEDRITLTWKFWDKNFVHIDIIESDKMEGAAIGSKLRIGQQDEFGSLREIVECYIIPCNRLVREVVGHQKFTDARTYQDLEARLKDEKKVDVSRIPYRFAILPQYPQHVVLSYIPKDKVLKEYIKVKPRGFYFHGSSHVPFQSLINWFKDNYSTGEYQRHLRKNRSPRLQPKSHNPSESANQAKGSAHIGIQMNNFNGGGSVHSQGDTQMWGGRAGRSPAYGRQRGSSPGYGASYRQDGAQVVTSGWDMTAKKDSGAYGGGGGDDHDRGRGRASTSASGSRTCYNCKQEGHIARDCPSGDQRPRRPMECYKCHQAGHIARECPNATEGADAYKRQRRDDDGGYSRPDGGNKDSMAGQGYSQASAHGYSGNQDMGGRAGGEFNNP